MRNITRLCIITTILYTFFPANIQARADEVYLFRLRDGTVVNFKEMMKDVRDSNVIFIGEFHDNEFHHRFQLDFIKELHASNANLSVGLEMLASKSQKDLDLWTAGRLPIDDFIKTYYENWRVPWTFYNDIFIYLRDQRIHAVGLNLQRDIVQKVRKSGLSSLARDGLTYLPPRISCKVDPKYMAFIKMAYIAHGHNDMKLDHFCEAQVLWDEVMAWNLSTYIKKEPDSTVIVLTGRDHAWKRGIPVRMIKYLKAIKYTVILGGLPVYIDLRRISTEEADYILLGNITKADNSDR